MAIDIRNVTSGVDIKHGTVVVNDQSPTGYDVINTHVKTVPIIADIQTKYDGRFVPISGY